MKIEWWLAALVATAPTSGCAARRATGSGDGNPAGSAVACGADRDCKLDRICERGICVWPEPASTPRPVDADALTEAPAGDGGTVRNPFAPLRPAGTMFRSDAQHRGRSPYLLPAAAPTLAWRFDTGGPVTSSPTVLADGVVAVGSHDGQVYLVDPLGKKRGSFATGDLIFSSPAFDRQGRVLIGSDDDHLYAFDSNTQQLAFRLRLGNCAATRGVGPEASRCDVDGGPTIGPDGTIYVGGHGVFAIAPDGKLKWHFATPGRVPTAPALLPDGTIVAGGHDDLLFALSPDGQKRWDFRTGGDIESSPAVAEDGSIYFGSDDRKVYALNAAGELLWAFNTGGEVRASPALGRDGMVVVGSFDGLLYAISRTGTVAWTFRAGDRIASSALVDAQGALLFGAQDDRLYALESDGRPRWSLELAADVDSSPALGADGTIFVGCDDRGLYAFK